jgi:hypothetical protein
MHTGGKENQSTNYPTLIGSQALTETTTDIGILVSNDLKPSSHCASAAAKASSVMGLVTRNFKNLDQENILVLNKTYIKPRLEYSYRYNLHIW